MKGLVRGLRTTLRTLARRPHTAQYPHVEPELPERSRGVIALLEENCTSCMLCARECPDWCIYIDSHKEEDTEASAAGGRTRQKNVLDRFEIDFSLCMYCGICIEVCPFDALFWAPDFAYAEGDIRNLLHGKEKLGTWMGNVPPATLPQGYAAPSAPDGDHTRVEATTEVTAPTEVQASTGGDSSADPSADDDVDGRGPTS